MMRIIHADYLIHYYTDTALVNSNYISLDLSCLFHNGHKFNDQRLYIYLV